MDGDVHESRNSLKRLQQNSSPNRVNIDTGAYATGNLTLLCIRGTRLLAW
jgi:hypothetical protein